ncbi:TetR/AcrR family transcriptional regulator [Frondihabitans cladoniiphilus]|uniref:HTH tetR-type domain-containing protein n=1 Tax=Frondihabitans cladoniiphilus TaxID=715785 RepID=A0ABP8VUP0_9MICO
MRTGIDGRRLRSIKSRAEILDAAEALFGTTGYDATSLRAIAQAIGMSTPGLQRHFATKADVLTALLARIQNRNEEHLASFASTAVSPREFTTLLAAQRMEKPHELELTTILLGEATDPEHPAHDYLASRFDRTLQRLSGAFGERSLEVYAGWSGLVLLWSYFPERIDPVALLEAWIRRLEENAVDGKSGSKAGDAARVVAEVDYRLPVRAREADEVGGKLTERRIVEAAARAFARGGYRPTSLRQIATDLETSHGALLYWFANKQALLEAVLGSRDPNLPTSFATSDEALAALSAVYPLARANEADLDQVRLYQVLVCESVDPAHPAHGFFERRYGVVIARFTAAMTVLQEAGILRPELDPEEEAVWLTALWDGLQLHSFYRLGLDVPERLRRHLNTLLTVTLPPV